MALSPTAVEHLNALGAALRRAGENEEAMEVYARALAEDPENRVAQVSTGVVF